MVTQRRAHSGCDCSSQRARMIQNVYFHHAASSESIPNKSAASSQTSSPTVVCSCTVTPLSPRAIQPESDMLKV